MGVKSSIAAIVPTATHITASQLSGRNPTVLHAQAQQQIVDVINALKQVVADMTKGNPSDPNIATLTAQITALS
jgi:hypothetical protein